MLASRAWEGRKRWKEGWGVGGWWTFARKIAYAWFASSLQIVMVVPAVVMVMNGRDEERRNVNLKEESWDCETTLRNH